VRNALCLLEAHWLAPSSVHFLSAAAAIHNTTERLSGDRGGPSGREENQENSETKMFRRAVRKVSVYEYVYKLSSTLCH
jgi:hypothetical protein